MMMREQYENKYGQNSIQQKDMPNVEKKCSSAIGLPTWITDPEHRIGARMLADPFEIRAQWNNFEELERNFLVTEYMQMPQHAYIREEDREECVMFILGSATLAGLGSECAHLGIVLFDRWLQEASFPTRAAIHAIASASFWVAAKVHYGRAPYYIARLQSWLVDSGCLTLAQRELAPYASKVQHLFALERQLLFGLNFSLNAPTSSECLHALLARGGVSLGSRIAVVACALLDLSAVHSKVALSSVDQPSKASDSEGDECDEEGSKPIDRLSYSNYIVESYEGCSDSPESSHSRTQTRVCVRVDRSGEEVSQSCGCTAAASCVRLSDAFRQGHKRVGSQSQPSANTLDTPDVSGEKKECMWPAVELTGLTPSEIACASFHSAHVVDRYSEWLADSFTHSGTAGNRRVSHPVRDPCRMSKELASKIGVCRRRVSSAALFLVDSLTQLLIERGSLRLPTYCYTSLRCCDNKTTDVRDENNIRIPIRRQELLSRLPLLYQEPLLVPWLSASMLASDTQLPVVDHRALFPLPRFRYQQGEGKLDTCRIEPESDPETDIQKLTPRTNGMCIHPHIARNQSDGTIENDNLANEYNYTFGYGTRSHSLPQHTHVQHHLIDPLENLSQPSLIKHILRCPPPEVSGHDIQESLFPRGDYSALLNTQNDSQENIHVDVRESDCTRLLSQSDIAKCYDYQNPSQDEGTYTDYYLNENWEDPHIGILDNGCCTLCCSPGVSACLRVTRCCGILACAMCDACLNDDDYVSHDSSVNSTVRRRMCPNPFCWFNRDVNPQNEKHSRGNPPLHKYTFSPIREVGKHTRAAARNGALVDVPVPSDSIPSSTHTHTCTDRQVVRMSILSKQFPPAAVKIATRVLGVGNVEAHTASEEQLRDLDVLLGHSVCRMLLLVRILRHQEVIASHTKKLIGLNSPPRSQLNKQSSSELSTCASAKSCEKRRLKRDRPFSRPPQVSPPPKRAIQLPTGKRIDPYILVTSKCLTPDARTPRSKPHLKKREYTIGSESEGIFGATQTNTHVSSQVVSATLTDAFVSTKCPSTLKTSLHTQTHTRTHTARMSVLNSDESSANHSNTYEFNNSQDTQISISTRRLRSRNQVYTSVHTTGTAPPGVLTRGRSGAKWY
eukprot:GHVR01040518.1.p1 GENE.GHVR01040518.1~~GHVR01040518.1.p1  ORF type:complete len:1128 (-),score=101.88 GHVR01040518.1:405-3788(-)